MPNPRIPVDPKPRADRPARRRTDAISPGERRTSVRSLQDRAKANDDSPLESLGKAMSSPVIEAAEEDEKKR